MKLQRGHFSLWVVAGIVTFISVFGRAAQADDPADPAFQQWRSAVKSAQGDREYGQMILLAQGWMHDHPDSALACTFQGIGFYEMGDFAKARQAFADGKKLTPAFSEGDQWVSYMDRIDQKYGPLPPVKVVTADVANRENEWVRKAQVMLKAQQYDAIEQTASELAKSQSCAANGRWDLFSFADGLKPEDSQDEASWKSNYAQMTVWVKARPLSSLAKICAVNSLVEGAWTARGETTEVDDPRQFASRLDAAVPFLEKLQVPSKTAKSPLFYQAFLSWSLLAGTPRPVYDAAFREGTTAYPNCTDLYLTKAMYLMPRWYGEQGEWEKFAANSANKIGGEEGDMLYARICWRLFDLTRHDDFREKSNPSWPRIDSGLKAILKKYPDSLSAATRLYVYSQVQPQQDVPTALALLQNQIHGDVDLTLFGSPGYFGANRMNLLENTLTNQAGPVNSFAQPIGQPPSQTVNQTVVPQFVHPTANDVVLKKLDEPIHVVAPTVPDLIGWWNGDGDALDSLGKNNGRIYGGVTFGPGLVGQAFHFDGAKSYVKVPTTDLNPGSGAGFTIDMWIRPDDVTERRPLAGWSATSTPGVSFWMEPADAGGLARLGADLRDSAGGSHRVLSEIPVIQGGKWQQVALSYRKDTGVIDLFCDGKMVQEKQIGPLELQTSLDFFIGKHVYISGGDVTFKGIIDEVCVYSRGLGLEEIQRYYEAGSAGKQIYADTQSNLTTEQRWQVRNKRLHSFALKNGGAAMSFATKIDGSDFVHIQGDKVWYVHRSWQLPGKEGGTNDPTYVNGSEWQPTWDGNNSDKFTLTASLPAIGTPVLTIDALKQGGNLTPVGPQTSITVTQNPTAENGYEAILLLNDDNDAGSHWFIFNVSWADANAAARK